jgi:hypothetical protein
MGVIFQKEVQVEPLTDTIANAITTHMQAALAATAPSDPKAMLAQAQAWVQPAARDAAQAAARPPTKMRVNWVPFFISLGIFFVLLAIAVFLDWQNIVDDPAVYTGMVTTVLGAVLGFLTGDATSTTSPN